MAQDVITQAPLGFGLGLRTQHFDAVLNTEPDIDWFEVLSENYMVAGGKPRYYLKEIGERYPLVMHGVSLSIGSTDPLNMDYLKALKQLVNDVQPQWISDHICWTSIHGVNSHDLLPLPYTEETVKHVAQRIKTVQDFLGRRILMENVSSYLSYQDSSMDEWEFVNAVAEAADCLILLDINNIYVSARNHNFNPLDYLNKINPKRVQQFHLAGHSDYGDYVIDTHDHDVPSSVWDLYCAALKRFGGISTMIERDANIPEFSALETELTIARNIARDTLGKTHPLNAAKGRKNMHEGKVTA
ncbi:hypothetical protein A1L58_03160 [Shewanella baltica]|uniref:MNIO family bufferin maturase n=1 Tax=Shewanella baltica TaxID=62322 RepID=UPI0001E1116B|nr:DUF692 domain-containing protein [Shewanella baltica]AEG10345.1 UPF0276 protein [Shewanella baltica BA175]EHQ16121.1 UPF0276 protein [Shewanella baltica OS183]KZK67339.1 hypothetical protein A1L58_03160 [Shewanella baltica]MCS6233926.1 DUF692 domain-containing protein [Shewanella baltica]MCS6257767.1 DUF692 domain-containing protein [Shewanella baltica]